MFYDPTVRMFDHDSLRTALTEAARTSRQEVSTLLKQEWLTRYEEAEPANEAVGSNLHPSYHMMINAGSTKETKIKCQMLQWIQLLRHCGLAILEKHIGYAEVAATDGLCPILMAAHAIIAIKQS